MLGCRADVIGTMTITVQSWLMFAATVLTIRGGEPKTPPWLSHSSWALKPVQCCFTSTETVEVGNSGQPPRLSGSWALTLIPGQCCFMSTETVVSITDGSPGRPLSLSHSSWALTLIPIQCCFTFTETILGTRSTGRPPRLSEFSQLLGSEACSVLLYVHRDRSDYNGLYVDYNGLYHPGRPPRLSHSSWALSLISSPCCFTDY